MNNDLSKMIWMALRHEMGRIMPISLNYKKKNVPVSGTQRKTSRDMLGPYLSCTKITLPFQKMFFFFLLINK